MMAAVVGLLAAGALAWAQPRDGRAAALLEASRRAMVEEGPAAARESIEQALLLFRRDGDRTGEMEALRTLGACRRRLGDPSGARAALDRSLAIARELGDRGAEGRALTNLGLVAWEIGEFSEAERNLAASAEIGRELDDPEILGASLNNLGLVLDELGRYDESVVRYREALAAYRAGDFPRGEADALGNLAGLHLLLGRFKEARAAAQGALDASERLGSTPAIAQDLINLGESLRALGLVAEALPIFDRALDLTTRAGMSKEQAQARQRRAAAHVDLGAYDLALEDLGLAIAVYERAGYVPDLTLALVELAQVHLALGDVSSSEIMLQRAARLARGLDHALAIRTSLLALADLELRLERLDQAEALLLEALGLAEETADRWLESEVSRRLGVLELARARTGWAESSRRHAQRALSSARDGATPQGVAAALHLQSLIALQAGDAPQALALLEQAARALPPVAHPDLDWRLAFDRGRALQALRRGEEALAAFRLAASGIEGTRGRLVESRFRSGYLDDKYDVYFALVGLLIGLDRPEEAFVHAERLRALSMEELDRARPRRRDPEERAREVELRARVERLREAVESERSRSSREQRQAALEVFTRELLAAEAEYQRYLDDVRSREQVLSVRHAIEVAPLARTLPADTALVEFLVDRDRTYGFVLRREGLEVEILPVGRAALRSRIELLRDLVARREGESWREPAFALRRSLVTPLEEAGLLRGVRELRLVAHDALHYLPFGALPVHAGAGASLLIDQYVLSLAHTSGSRDDFAARPSPPATMLALAPARARLRHAEREAREVGDLFAGASTVLTGRRATEAALRGRGSEFRYVHLATHGRFNRLFPLLSALELEPGDGEDGTLELHEVLELELRAELVTLSGCDTALGAAYFADVPLGGDVIGLTHAFLSAGSRSVVATLWPVDDAASRAFMTRFYRELAGHPVAEALALAQRASLSGDREAHPYYWAAYVAAAKAPSSRGGEVP